MCISFFLEFEEFKEFGANLLVVDLCTSDEALAFRKRLRLVGEDQFIRETVESGSITAKKLCTAFEIRPPLFLEGLPDVSSLHIDLHCPFANGCLVLVLSTTWAGDISRALQTRQAASTQLHR